MHQTCIPDGSRLQPLLNGDVLIFYPGASVPTLCVQADQQVHIAIRREPVEAGLAEAARRYVQRSK